MEINIELTTSKRRCQKEALSNIDISKITTAQNISIPWYVL